MTRDNVAGNEGEFYRKLEERLYQPAKDKRIYYWIVSTFQGRRIILGPEVDEARANEIGFEKLEGSFEVVPLPTRDQNTATRMLKHRFLVDTGDIGGALKRARHKV